MVPSEKRFKPIVRGCRAALTTPIRRFSFRLSLLEDSGIEREMTCGSGASALAAAVAVALAAVPEPAGGDVLRTFVGSTPATPMFPNIS